MPQRDEGGQGAAESCVRSCSTTVSASRAYTGAVCLLVTKKTPLKDFGQKMFLFRMSPKGIYLFTLFGVVKASAKLRSLGAHVGVEGAP